MNKNKLTAIFLTGLLTVAILWWAGISYAYIWQGFLFITTFGRLGTNLDDVKGVFMVSCMIGSDLAVAAILFAFVFITFEIVELWNEPIDNKDEPG